MKEKIKVINKESSLENFIIDGDKLYKNIYRRFVEVQNNLLKEIV